MARYYKMYKKKYTKGKKRRKKALSIWDAGKGTPSAYSCYSGGMK